jgi:hypothetical protein
MTALPGIGEYVAVALSLKLLQCTAGAALAVTARKERTHEVSMFGRI